MGIGKGRKFSITCVDGVNHFGWVQKGQIELQESNVSQAVSHA